MRTFILVSHRRGPSFCLAYPTERGPSIIVSHPLVVLTTWHFLSHQSWARLDLVLVHHRTEVLIRLHSTKNSDSNARRTITPAVALHLESQGQPSSAGSKPSEATQPLTLWRAKDSRRQQARNPASHRNHSPTGEPRTVVVSRLETQRGTVATHFLESQGQPSSAGSKPSEPPQPLTLWRAEDSRRQQARNAASHRSHSLPGEPRTAVVSRLETQRGTAATH